ncbi:hypothetical protein SH501x_001712 [Pirellulaceae bacterium SH501]
MLSDHLAIPEESHAAVTYPKDWANVIEAAPITDAFIRCACSFADI